MNLLTPDEAAETCLRWTGKRRGRRLMRLVLAKERKEGREIAVRLAGTGTGTRYRLTESMLHLHLPELFESDISTLATLLSKRLDDLRSTLGAEVDERMAPQIESVRAEHNRLASRVTTLVTSTEDGFKRFHRRIRRLEVEFEKKSARECPPGSSK